MRSPWNRAALAAAMVTVAASVPLIVAPSALASLNCQGTVAAGSTYLCRPGAGGYIRITVPARVGSVVVVADGGGGGKNDIHSGGGSGARVSASVTVTPGEVITVYVGSGGGAAVGGVGNVGGSGYGAGGNGGPYWGEGFGGGYGGGGGGSSAVLFGGDDTIIAGGGGGGGGFFAGGHATTNSAAGGSGGGDGSCSIGGGGGNANGLGGAGSSSGSGMTSAATSGFAGSGGDGTYGAGGSTSGGGGGGGGYGGGGPGNWTGPHACLIAGGGGAGGSYGPTGASFGLAGNGGMLGTSGEGGDGSVSLSFVAAAPATPPGPPTDLIVSGVDDTSMDLSWTAPASDGGSLILGYDVAVDGGSPARVMGLSHSLSGLTAGQTYSLSITAVNAEGSSTALTGSQQTTSAGAPTGPATNLVFPDRTFSTITADWTPPADDTVWPTLGYQVRVNGGPLTFTADDSYVARGLEPATTYTFEIYVINGAGTSTALTGDETTYSTTPSPPTDLVFSAVHDTSITASWTAPVSNGGSAVTGYWVSIDGGASVWSPTATYTKTGLTPATWHTFAIQAQNANGASLELTGVQPTEATPTSPRMTATSVTVGSPSTVTLVNFPADTTQTVMVMAPDASVSNVTVTVNGSGSGTGTYTPASTGSYNLVSDPNATSATFTASAAPGPGPGPGPGPAPTPAITPLNQVIDGMVGTAVTGTTAFTASNFAQPPTFAIAPALPAGLSIDPQTGVVSGTPTAPQVSTEHVVTATAASQSATATLQVTIVDAPPPPPVTSILISGRAGMGKRAPRIYVTGSSTGLANTMVVAHVRLPGQRMYSEVGTRTVRADGSFTWSMRTSKRAYVYFTGEAGVRSKRVIISRG